MLIEFKSALLRRDLQGRKSPVARAQFDEFWQMSPLRSSGCESPESRSSLVLHLLSTWPKAALGHSHCVFAQSEVLKGELVSRPLLLEEFVTP